MTFPRHPLFMTKRSVYFVQESLVGAIKIGVASDVERRLKIIQTDCPGTLTLLAVMPGVTNAVEPELHLMFSRFHIRGEWFRSDPELLEFIESVAVTVQALAFCMTVEGDVDVGDMWRFHIESFKARVTSVHDFDKVRHDPRFQRRWPVPIDGGHIRPRDWPRGISEVALLARDQKGAKR
jgi:hypothetical protein